MSSNSNKNRAFYEAPKDRILPSEIINQARTGLKAYPTDRPSTPRTDNRNLFSLHHQRSSDSRNAQILPNTNKLVDVDNIRSGSGSRLLPLNRHDSLSKLTQNSKQGIEIKRLSDAWESTTEVERHSFSNVQNRTGSVSNLANTTNMTEKETSSRNKNAITHSESFSSGLPPTSPTRTNPTRHRNKSISKQHQIIDSNSRLSSADSQRSSSSSSNINNKPKYSVYSSNNSTIGRADSASSCSSNSSVAHAKRIQRYRTKSMSKNEENQDEMETPRPVNSAGDHSMKKKKVSEKNYNVDAFYKETIRPILDILGAPSEYRRKNSTDDFIDLTKVLYQNLKEHDLLGKHSPYRSDILKAVFKVLDSNNEVLVMSAARIIISMKVSGINLTNICNLIFKVSKNKKNDHLFREYEMPELLVKTIENVKPDQNHTALLYLMCIMKFLTQISTTNTSEETTKSQKINSNNVDNTDGDGDDDDDDDDDDDSDNIADALVKFGLFEKISKLLQGTVDINVTTGVNSNFCDFITQCLCCLTNLEDRRDITRKEFVYHRIPERTALLIDQYYNNQQLVFEASRLLSRLTQFSDCCQQIEHLLDNFCPRCLNIMVNSQDDQLVLRIAFIIGDLLTKSEEARHCLFPDKSSLDTFLHVFNIYLKKYLNSSDFSTSSSSSQSSSSAINTHILNTNTVALESSIEPAPSSMDDILVKLLRVIANAAIAESVGRMTASSKTCLRFILLLINSKKTLDREELLTISISALNNLSFYMTSTSNSDVKGHHIKIIESLYKIIINKNGKEHLGGVIKVLGNLSRENYMRDWIVENQLMEFLITMLDSDNQDTVFFTVGVLLNLMTDAQKRHILLEHNGISGLIEVLRDFASRDWQLAGLVCQTLWNYTESIPTSLEAVMGGEHNTEELLQLLTLFCDNEEVDTLHRAYNSDDNAIEYLTNSWQTEFLPVAQDLLSRLEVKINQFEPLSNN